MYMIYNNQFNEFDSAIKRIDISKGNFKFDPNDTGVWLTTETTVEFIPMHMVRKVVFDKEKVSV